MAPQPRILVIDDDSNFRQLMAHLLKSHFDVTIAANGEEGFELAMARPPHVALIDVNMPHWDGMETLRKFREHPKLAATRTAMLTADATRRTVVTAIQHGADEYLVKTSFNKTELLDKLRCLVAKSSLPLEDGDHTSALVGSRIGNAAKDNDPRLQELLDDWE